MDLLDLFIGLRGITMFQAQREIKFAGNRCYEVYTVVMLEPLDHFRRTARIDRRENLGREIHGWFPSIFTRVYKLPNGRTHHVAQRIQERKASRRRFLSLSQQGGLHE